MSTGPKPRAAFNDRDSYHLAQSRAWSAVRVALAEGRVERQPCACGATRTRAHHDDYRRPLDVRWVCRACHVRRHRELGWGYPRGPSGVAAFVRQEAA